MINGTTIRMDDSWMILMVTMDDYVLLLFSIMVINGDYWEYSGNLNGISWEQSINGWV